MMRFVRLSSIVAPLTSVIGLATILLTGCLPTSEPQIIFSPPPGSYSGQIYVSMNVTGLNPFENTGTPRIIYTASNEPLELDTCPDFFSTPVALDSTAVIRARYTTDNISLSREYTGQYTFPGGSGGNQANLDAILNWQKFESAAVVWLGCEFNGCALPDASNSPMLGCTGRKCLPWVIRQDHDGDGVYDGLVSLGTGAIDLGANRAETVVTVTNFRMVDDTSVMISYSQTLPASQQLQNTDYIPSSVLDSTSSGALAIPVDFNLTVTGKTVGSFSISPAGAIGEQKTQIPIATSGMSNATIEESSTLENQIKTSGYYTVTCSDTGCAPGSQRYLIGAGNTLSLYKSVDIPDSCPDPFFMIHNREDASKCMTRSGSSTRTIRLSACDPNNEDQHWTFQQTDLVLNLSSDTDGDGTPDTFWSKATYTIVGLGTDNGTCLNDGSGGSVFFTNYTMMDCLSVGTQAKYAIYGSGISVKFSNRDSFFCPGKNTDVYNSAAQAFECGNTVFQRNLQWGVTRDGIAVFNNPEEYIPPVF